MPKTEHYQWYVEEFSPTEFHHHAIDELYYSGRTPFQSVAVLRTPAFGKMLVLDGDTQSSQADEKIYHESLVHPALAAIADRTEILILGGGEGATLREALRHPGVRAARWSTSTARSSSWPRNICPSGRPARSTTRARAWSSATRWLSQAGHGYVRRDHLRPHRTAGGFAVVPALQQRGISRYSCAAGAGRRVRAASQHRRLSQHGAACEDGAFAARALRARASFYTHVPAFDNDWAFIACSDGTTLRRSNQRRSMRTSPSCAAKTISTMRKHTGGCSVCRSICAANLRSRATSSLSSNSNEETFIRQRAGRWHRNQLGARRPFCGVETVTGRALRFRILRDPFGSRSVSRYFGIASRRARSWPKTICLNSTRGTLFFSARMRSSAPSQLFRTNRPSNAAGNWSLRVPCS